MHEMLRVRLQVGIWTDACLCLDQLNIRGDAIDPHSHNCRTSDDTRWLNAEEVFQMATEEAKALGQENLGRTARGCLADLVTSIT